MNGREGWHHAGSSDPARLAGWMAAAGCFGVDPELFFPDPSTDHASQQVEQAKAVCGTCRVREPCLRWAADRQVRFGIWGGLTPTERQAQLSQR